MHFPLKFPLLATMVFVAAALAVPSASAQGVEVTHTAPPETGVPVHCPDVILHGTPTRAEGGCHLFATTAASANHDHTFELTAHLFGAPFHSADCHNSFEIRMDENGEGYIQDIQFTQGTEGDLGCGATLFRPCTPAEAHGTAGGPWHVDTVERADPDPPDNPEVFVATVEACFVSEDLGRCEGPVALEVAEDPLNAEDYEAELTPTHAGQPNGIPCDLGSAEFTAHYDLTPENPTEEEIHFNHVN